MFLNVLQLNQYCCFYIFIILFQDSKPNPDVETFKSEKRTQLAASSESCKSIIQVYNGGTVKGTQTQIGA